MWAHTASVSEGLCLCTPNHLPPSHSVGEAVAPGGVEVGSILRWPQQLGEAQRDYKKRILKASKWQGVLMIVLRKVLFLSAFARKLDSQGMKIATVNTIRDGLSTLGLFERIQNE